jgi:hypothetical protein
VPAGPRGYWYVREPLEQRRERGAAEVRHAEHAHVAGHVVEHGVERHDIRVLEPRQRQVLAAVERRDLEHDRPVRQRRLRRDKDAPARPARELRDQSELADALAHLRVSRSLAVRLEQQPAVAVEHHAQRVRPLREPVEQVAFRGRVVVTCGGRRQYSS